MERFVIDQIRRLGSDKEFVDQMLEQLEAVDTDDADNLQEQQRIACQELKQCEAEVRQHAASGNPDRLADAQERLQTSTQRLAAIRDSRPEHDSPLPDHNILRQALADFDPVWNALSPDEQHKVMQLLVQRIDYNGDTGRLEITFRPNGFDGFLEQFSEKAVA